VKKPEVLAVIVSYRSAKLAVDCLRSIAIERQNPEIAVRAVVVDNASGDAAEIRAAIEQENLGSWVTLIEADHNGGFAYGNNVGFRHAYESGQVPDYFHLLNPDTVVRPGGIAELVHFLEERRDVGIGGSSFELPDGSPWPIAFRFPTIWSEIDQALAWGLVSKLLGRFAVARTMSNQAEPIDWIPGASMMIRRELLEKVGGLDERYFLYFEETDWCQVAKEAGFPCWYVPQSRVMHIVGQSTGVTSKSARPKRLPKYWYESRRRYFTANYGVPYAIATDLALLLAHGVGAVKRTLLRRGDQAIPNFVADFIASSVILPQNRSVPPAERYVPDR
jgi:GT2 family glycosyltransferase